jgi:NAD(P)H-nitrite reductase large subunit
MPKKDITEKGAVLQRDGETYAILPRIPCGYITNFSVLRRIAEAAARYGARAIEITWAQRIAIVVGVKEEHLERFWRDLRTEPGLAVWDCVRSATQEWTVNLITPID